MSELYVGLMSGTSLDAIDAVIVDFTDRKVKLIATHSEPISPELKTQILALCEPGHNAIQRMGETDTLLGHLFAESVLTLLKKANLSPAHIRAIGSHGQTIRHEPEADFPFTLQIGDPNRIAAKTGIITVADFRRRDMALGGEGAPLAPAFHKALLRSTEEDRWVLNIGGIANLTYLPSDKTKAVVGFDTGPGNTLLDAWCMQAKKMPFDKNGEWASTGNVDPTLLDALFSDSYFKKQPPKSTGREKFNLTWLNHHLSALDKKPSPEDIQATLLELTAKSITQGITSNAGSIWLCGGGVHNLKLIARLKALNPTLRFMSTATAGIHPDWLEAAAFAWLARQTLKGFPGNLPSVTGAKTSSVLGAVYPG